MSVPGMTGPATCPACRRSNYLKVKRRYQQSEKGKATARAREERADVREKRRLFALSEQGRKNHVKYSKTDKGRETARRGAARYSATEKGKRRAAEHHLATKAMPHRIAQKKRAEATYAKTDKMDAKKRRDYARRKAAIVAEAPFTAEMWLALVERHKNRCHYCKQRRVLTLDHVTPVSKGGKHVEENIVPACKSCNSKKGNRIVLLV